MDCHCPSAELQETLLCDPALGLASELGPEAVPGPELGSVGIRSPPTAQGVFPDFLRTEAALCALLIS